MIVGCELMCFYDASDSRRGKDLKDGILEAMELAYSNDILASSHPSRKGRHDPAPGVYFIKEGEAMTYYNPANPEDFEALRARLENIL